jgi:hypothetical protein
VNTAKSSPQVKATFLIFKKLSKSKQSTDAVTLAAIFQNSGRKKSSQFTIAKVPNK